LVNSYIRETGGNVAKAWAIVVSHRKDGTETGVQVANAEHYLYNRMQAQEGIASGLLSGFFFTAYDLWKGFEQMVGLNWATDSGTSPASVNQLDWAHKE